MGARVVLVPENDVGLVAVSQLLHVFPPDGRQCLTDLIEGNKQLTREIAATFIRGIKVYNDKRIEIEWNFADELVKYVEQVQKICS